MKVRTSKLFIIFLLVFIANSFTQESIILTKRQLCDLELILNGGFAPLQGFMDQDNFESVIERMRLVDDTVWPIPIIFDVSQQQANKITSKDAVSLKDPEGTILATLEVSDVWRPDKNKEAQLVYGTTNDEHPGVHCLFHQTKDYYVGGKVTKVAMPKHYDFVTLRKQPAELKHYFKEHGYDKVVAFQTRNPMHRAHQELTHRAAKQINGHLLLHPVVGLTKPGDVDHFTRVKCYKKLLKYYPEDSVTLSLLPISMRMAGPREAVWHAIIRKNYGATHFIVGRDHAGPGKDSSGNDFYGLYEAQELVKKYADEIGIEIIPFQEMCYVANEDKYYPRDEIPQGAEVLTISGTQLRAMLREGKEIPSWFSYPEVVKELRKTYPPKSQQGFTVFMTGLSGAGKSTIANALAVKLMEIQDRQISILDGDVIRTHLSQELGFSKEHRSMNVRRVGYVAQEITKNSGIAICCLIAPYEEDRQYNRNLIERGGFIEVHVATPLQICEDRDPKGLYALAREGKIQNFTGISDPYEVPKNPEIAINTTEVSVEQAVEIIVNYLKQEGYLPTQS